MGGLVVLINIFLIGFTFFLFTGIPLPWGITPFQVDYGIDFIDIKKGQYNKLAKTHCKYTHSSYRDNQGSLDGPEIVTYHRCHDLERLLFLEEASLVWERPAILGLQDLPERQVYQLAIVDEDKETRREAKEQVLKFLDSL